MPNKLVQCGLHLELQKYGQQIDFLRPELKDVVKSAAVLQEAQQAGIARMGIELSFAQSRALFAVQTLLDETDYKGNTGPATPKSSNPYFFMKGIPRVSVSAGEYLHAYGLPQRKTARGKLEFNGEARNSALGVLRDLSKARFLLMYEKREYDKQGQLKKKPQLVEAVAPLIALKETKSNLLITPNPILVDQIDTYFMWKPVDLYTKVLDGKDRTKALFIELLLYWFEMNRRGGEKAVYIVKRQMDVIAHALRMDSLLKNRQDKQIRKRLTGLYEYAVKIGYLKDFAVDVPGAKAAKIDRLHLNSATFRALRKV